jgi:hypothetical protein
MRFPWRRTSFSPEESGTDLLNVLAAGPGAGDLLTHLGATVHPLPEGWWVYALHEPNGTIFRAGQVSADSAGNLLSRLRDHKYTYGDRMAYYSLLRVRDAHQADLYEGMVIDWYQPAECSAGTAEVEALRRRIRQSAGGSGLGKGYRERAI